MLTVWRHKYESVRHLLQIYDFNDLSSESNRNTGYVQSQVQVYSYLFPNSTLLVKSKQAHRYRKSVRLCPHMVAIWGPFTAGVQRERAREKRERERENGHHYQAIWASGTPSFLIFQCQQIRCGKTPANMIMDQDALCEVFWSWLSTSLTDSLTAHESKTK